MKKQKNDNNAIERDNISDSALFKAAVSGTRPLKNNNIRPASPKTKPIRVHRHPHPEPHAYPLFDLGDRTDTSSAEETLAYRGNGIQQNLFKKLKNGQIPIESRLDLHGHTVHEARSALTQFISDKLNQQCRCVIIIHGKGWHSGTPVLKAALKHWLKQIPDILAFSSAQPRHGGTGAVYVLLKSKPIKKVFFRKNNGFK